MGAKEIDQIAVIAAGAGVPPPAPAAMTAKWDHYARNEHHAVLRKTWNWWLCL